MPEGAAHDFTAYVKLQLVAGLLLALPLATFGQTQPPRQVVSSWEVVREPGGAVRQTLVTRGFEFAQVDLGAPRYSEVLLSQEVRRTFRSDGEGDNGQVTLEAWARAAADTSFGSHLWRVQLRGSRANLLADYDDVTAFGCCGSHATHTYVSLATGRSVITFTDGPIPVWGRGGTRRRADRILGVTFMNTNALSDSPYLTGSNVIGELQFTVGDSVLTRVVLRSADTSFVGLPTPGLSLLAADGSETISGIALNGAEQGAIRLTWSERGSEPRLIEIPLTRNGMSLTGAKLPTKITAQLVK